MSCVLKLKVARSYNWVTPSVLGDLGLMKGVSEFLFEHLKCHFLYPKIANFGKKARLYVPKNESSTEALPCVSTFSIASRPTGICERVGLCIYKSSQAIESQ